MESVFAHEFSLLRKEINPEEGYQGGLTVANQMYEVLLAQGNEKLAGVAARSAAEACRRLGDLDKSSFYLLKAAELLSEVGDRAELGWLSWGKANWHRNKGDYVAARKDLEAALQNFKSGGDQFGYIYTLAGLAEIERIVGEYDSALSKHLSLSRIFLDLKDPRGYTWALEGTAQIYRVSGNIEVASSLFHSCEEICRQSQDVRGLGFALKGLGECLSISLRIVDGRQKLEEAILTFNSSGYKTGSGYSFKSLGDHFNRVGNIYEALRNYQIASDIFTDSDVRGLAYSRIAQASAYISLQDLDKAHAYANYSLNAFKELKIRRGIRQSRAITDVLKKLS